MPREIPPSILGALGAVRIEGLFYLVKFTLRNQTYYWAERELTFDGNTYEPRLFNISGLWFEFSSEDEVTLTLGNLDGLITNIERANSLMGAKVEVIEYIQSIDEGYVRWTGFADEVSEINLETAILPCYTGGHTASMEAPKRSIDIQCPWEFGGHPHWQPLIDDLHGQDSIVYEGNECRYFRNAQGELTPGRGFVTNLSGAIDAGDTTINVDGLPEGQVFKSGDKIRIDDEIICVIAGGATTLEVVRGVLGTVAEFHGSGAAVSFADCQFSIDACKRRGMYGNNPLDTYDVDSVTYKRNYFGGFPMLEGVYSSKEIRTQLSSKFRKASKNENKPLRYTFGGNESAYGTSLPLVYGHVLFFDPVLLVARPEGDFLLTLWAICEGVLGTNALNGNQDVMLNAYTVGEDGHENIWVNGVKRHDFTLGFGIQVGNGSLDHPPPVIPGVSTYEDDALALLGTAYVAVRISLLDNPTFDPDDINATGAMEIAYGRIVRVYESIAAHTHRPSTDPAWVLLDFMCSKRAGGARDYGEFNLQSFIDVADHNSGLVVNVINAESAARWSFNGVIDNKRAYKEYERQICLGMYCTPPFRGIDGKIKIKSIKDEVLTGLPIFEVGKNILANENGSSTLTKVRKKITELPNELKLNFLAYEEGVWTKTQMSIPYREAQRRIGRVVGDGSFRVVTKQIDLIGVTTVDEAARIGTLILRCGEFAEGGFLNNLRIKFKSFYKDASDLELADIIEVLDVQLDPLTERYFRIVSIKDVTVAVDGGGFLFTKEIEATIHDNSYYDDTAYILACEVNSRWS